MPHKLSLATLRKANMQRLPQFKNKHGQPAHTMPDGSDWSPAQWLQAVVGELGEYSNVRKKYERGDITFEEFRVLAAKELADVQTYLDLLALRCLDHGEHVHHTGIDLAHATVEKWNEVSARVACSLRIYDDEVTNLSAQPAVPVRTALQAIEVGNGPSACSCARREGTA